MPGCRPHSPGLRCAGTPRHERAIAPRAYPSFVVMLPRLAMALLPLLSLAMCSTPLALFSLMHTQLEAHSRVCTPRDTRSGSRSVISASPQSSGEGDQRV